MGAFAVEAGKMSLHKDTIDLVCVLVDLYPFDHFVIISTKTLFQPSIGIL